MANYIQYSGVSHKPDDLTAVDGSMSLCVNLVSDDGSLRPLEKPTPIATLPANHKVLFIHSASTYDNYIVLNGNKLKAIPQQYIADTGYIATEGAFMEDLPGEPQISALGNTLVLTFADSPIRYAVYKNGTYKPLADHPPFVPIKFSTNGTWQNKAFTTKAFTNSRPIGSFSNSESIADGTLTSYDKITLEDADKELNTPVLGAVNELIADITNSNKFCFPFFVRYAFRYYDGSLGQHSHPVLMIPNSYITASLSSFGFTGSSIGASQGSASAIAANLFHSFFDAPDISDWKDLIQGIDIFVSAPIYTYDQSGYIKGWAKKDTRLSQSSLQCNISFENSSNSEYFYSSNYHFILPQKEAESIREAVENCSIFYHISSIPFDLIGEEYLENGGWKQIGIRSDVLKSLTSQEVMTDDFNSHNSKIAEFATVYNNRLNLANITEEVTADVPADCQYYNFIKQTNKCDIITDIVANKKSNIIKSQEGTFTNIPRYMFFPNTGATATIFHDLTANKYYRMPMKEHSGLNGSVYFRGFGNDMPEETTEPVNAVASIKIPYPNKIYTSAVDNPFSFEPTMINTIGGGNIVALSSVTQAISQGQFGAFPLYAFTTEGIWALEVNSYGGWSSRSPVSRDVILAGTQPLAIDNAIVFLSAQGLMLLAGGDCKCISAVLTEENETLPAIPESIAPITQAQLQSLSNFPQRGSLAYDYAHARIYLFGDNSTAWIYSLRTARWSQAIFNGSEIYPLNAYPECQLASTGSNNTQSILRLDADCEYHDNGLILTRPLLFNSFNLRTINSVLTKGQFNSISGKNGNVSTVLYATPNNVDYLPIASSTREYIRRISGSPYKAHRLLLIADDITPQFSITGTAFTMAEKHSNKLR